MLIDCFCVVNSNTLLLLTLPGKGRHPVLCGFTPPLSHTAGLTFHARYCQHGSGKEGRGK